ncbi:MAG: D-alanine--D-alanine ligase family protein [Arenicellales bacterium]
MPKGLSSGMDNTPINLLILFGGRSCEHAVSVISAQSLVESIQNLPVNIQFIGITEQGQWRFDERADINALISEGVVNPDAGIAVLPDLNHAGSFIDLSNAQALDYKTDVLFPVLHGPYGEDGTIQGLFELFDVPYVGCGVAASACGMDKLLSKKLFEAAGIPQADYLEVQAHEWAHESSNILDEIDQDLNYPLFVKPANMGSSVGIRKVDSKATLAEAIDYALKFDLKVLVENGFEGMAEIECAILGNEDLEASVAGEIRAGAEFYDYDAKYVEDTASVHIPAAISEIASDKVQQYAQQAFVAIGGSGLARVDFFVDTKTDDVYINEINTIPGFTPISMYPKLMQASGLPYAALVAKLIELAIERFNTKKDIKHSYSV